MNSVIKNIENISEFAARAAAAGDADQAIKLASTVKVLADSYALLKEVEIHEKYHVEAEMKLPGEDILSN